MRSSKWHFAPLLRLEFPLHVNPRRIVMKKRLRQNLIGMLALLMPALGFSEVVAQDAAPSPAALVRVHLPITGNADQVLRNRLLRIRDQLLTMASAQKSDSRPLLVLELSPRPEDVNASDGSLFERAYSLARFVCSREMAGVKTVAFVPRSVRGHGVLLAMACEEIVMAPDALLGSDATMGQADDTSQTKIAGYREIAEVRRTIPTALAVGMIDPQTAVLQIETETGIEFILQRDFDEFAAEQEIVSEEVLVPVGTSADFDGREGRQFGFVKYLASTHQALAKAYDISPEVLEEDQAHMTDWKPVIIDVHGKITSKVAAQVESLLGSSLESGEVNWVGIRIDSAGGDLEASLRLATTLASLDANAVQTVAYVPSEAVGGAALVAMSCDRLVMHPTARLQASTAQLEEVDRVAVQSSLSESLAPKTSHSWSLLAAMVDPEIELLEYQNKITGAKRIMSGDEMTALPDALNWQQPQPIAAAKGPLEFSGERALELDLAWRNVESFDELKNQFALDIEPLVLEPNWALELIESLASPQFSVFLLMIGCAGLYFELRTPGMGIGGFVATVALVLFFWSKFLDGTSGWLEVLLFVTGMAFILLEVFVLPGFGIFGLGGGAMVVASLVLASLTFVAPHNDSEMRELVGSMGSVVFAGVGFIALMVLSNYFLPQVPVFRKMVLQPPPPEERAYMEKNEAVVDYSHLVGAEGVASTHLRPAGKAEIDHQLLDVIAEGEPLDAGAAVVVVDARGNRILVRSAKQRDS